MNGKALVGTSAFEAVSRKVRNAVVEVLEPGSRAPRVYGPGSDSLKRHQKYMYVPSGHWNALSVGQLEI